MSTPILRLVRGGRQLNLNDQSRYFLHDTFLPPGVSESPLVGGGTSANRMAGGTVYGVRAGDRLLDVPLNLRGDTSREIRSAARAVENFLRSAGDPDEKTYLEWNESPFSAVLPSWGQGGWMRYEVKFGSARLAPEYLRGVRLALDADLDVQVLIGPYAGGLPQIACEATGGVLEDRFGAVDGRPRGLIVPGAMTNKMTNPVFGHATPLTNWTAGAAITATANYDPRFIIPGARASARLVCDSGAGTTYVQSINVGSTSAHAFYAIVKLEDGGAVSASQVSLRYAGNSLSTTYTDLGDGFYLLRATATGVASAQNTGVIVSADTTIYLCYMACTASGFGVVWGDLLGCAWTGTAHESTSTRTAGRCRIPLDETIFSRQQGTVRVVWMSDQANTVYSANAHLWNATDLRAAFIAASDTWELHDGTNSLQTSATTFAAGVPVVLHFVWGNSGRAIYINGVSAASSASFAPPAQPTDLYIGTDTAAANHIGGTFLGFDVWTVPLSAAEIAADYANVAPLAENNEQVSAIPWLWTQDGDNIVDNKYTGTAVNTFICGGIPGSAPAPTALKITGSSALGGSWWLGRLAADVTIPVDSFFSEVSGSVSVGTSLVDTGEGITLPWRFYRHIQGHEWRFLTNLATAGTGLSLAVGMVFIGGGVQSIVTDSQSVSADVTGRDFETPPMVLRRIQNVFATNPNMLMTYDVNLFAKHSGGTANLSIDYLILAPSPLTKVHFPYTTGETVAHFSGRHAQVTRTVDDVPEELAFVYGDEFELVPGQYNNIITHGLTVTINQLLVFPRWALL